MLTLKNFTRYTPEHSDLMISALYLQSEDGEDWYYHLARFQPDTLKIAYDSKGTICSMSRDAGRLCPLGLSVTEVDSVDVPEGLSLSGRWCWDGTTIAQAEE